MVSAQIVSANLSHSISVSPSLALVLCCRQPQRGTPEVVGKEEDERRRCGDDGEKLDAGEGKKD